VIVVDDGSDEAELLKLEDSLKGLPVSLIKSAHKSNPALMRNIGLAKLGTKWVAFLDSDDFWFENKLETQLALAIDSGSKAICSNANRLSTNEKYLVDSRTSSFTLKNLLNSNQIINSSVLIERKFFSDIGGYVSSYNVHLAEDYATWLRIAYLTKWCFANDSLLAYDDTSVDGLSNTSKASQIDTSIHALVDFYIWKNGNKKNKRRLVYFTLRAIARL
jgi:glycosyltransferase involved in cell wall biosynthesis